MSSVVLRTSPALGAGDTELVQLNVVVQDDEWVGRFDHLQVFRSTQGPDGPFEELTGPDWVRPRLPKDGGDLPASPVTGPFVMLVGKELVLETDTIQTVITFTGSDPLTFAGAATQITQQSLGRVLAYVDAKGKMVIEANYPGLMSQLTILPSEAAILLGLPTVEPENLAQGRDPRPSLIQGQTLYLITDPFGSRAYHYRSRFIHNTTEASSDFSMSFSGATDVGVGMSNTIVGYVSLADINGKSLSNIEVHIYNEFNGSQVGGKLVAGASAVTSTDENGRAEFTLVRGQALTVSVQGTSLTRTITVPTDPTLQTFDLFDPNIGEVDVFKAAVPNIITAERRTL